MRDVYFVNGIGGAVELDPARIAPWFVIGGTGNLDVERNVMSVRVVAAKRVFQTIRDFAWVDWPYVVTGEPFATEAAARAGLAKIEAEERARALEELTWLDREEEARRERDAEDAERWRQEDEAAAAEDAWWEAEKVRAAEEDARLRAELEDQYDAWKLRECDNADHWYDVLDEVLRGIRPPRRAGWSRITA